MKRVVRALALMAAIAIMPRAQTNPLNMTTMQAVKDMGLGINLGNTFESTGSWITGNTVTAYETGWGSPVITKAMIDGYKTGGIKTVRIPVSWSNLMTGNNSGGTYTVSTALLNRVEEVVGYVLDNGMYAIVNIHWDGGWWEKFPTDSAECMKKYKRIWTQVSDKFKNHSGYLIFESLNEEGVWNDVWYVWGNNANDMAAKARAYGILNTINQEFTTLVRGSGGNNANRHLLIAGYETNIDRTIDAMFKMPTDTQNHRAVSVHYYDPFGFTHLEQNESWATMTMTWGTEAEINQLNTEMNKLKTNFVDKGIPVIVGEYGFASDLARAQSEITKYTLAVAEAIYTRDMCPVLWDINRDNRHDYYNRSTASWTDPQLVAGFKAIAGANNSSSSAVPSSSSRAVSSSSSRALSSSSVRSSSSRALSSSSVRSSSSAGTTFVLENRVPLTNFSVQALSGKRLLINVNSPTIMEIYDLKGKKTANFDVSGLQIVNLTLPNGIYFAKTRGMRNIKFMLK